MAIVFPASPNTNDTFTAGSITYKWDGAKWIGLGVTPADRLIEGSNSLEIDANNNLLWSGGGKVGVNKSTPSSVLHVAASGYQTCRLENTDNTADGPYIEFYNNSSSPAANDYIGILSFKNNNTAAQETTYSQIRGQSIDITDGSEDGSLSFHTRSNGSFAERMRVTFDGNLNIADGNLVFETAGTGIDFSANANAAGMTSELLDDYEEGTWTPAVNFGFSAAGFTYSRQEGHYTKIGRQVFCQLRITLTAKGSNTGGVTISGLPFTSLAVFTSTGINGQVHLGHDDGFSSAVGANPVSGYVEGGTDYFYLTDRDTNATINTLNEGDIDSNFSISASVVYYAT